METPDFVRNFILSFWLCVVKYEKYCGDVRVFGFSKEHIFA